MPSVSTDSLYFRVNLSPETIEKMKVYRKASIALSELIDTFGSSRELSIAFTAIEKAQMYVNKHLCLADSQAEKEQLT